MKKNILKNGILLGIIVVLLGASYVSGITIPGHNEPRDDNLNIYYRGDCSTTYEPTSVHTNGDYTYVTSKYVDESSCPFQYYGVLDIINVMNQQDPWIEGSCDDFHAALAVFAQEEYAYVLDFPQSGTGHSSFLKTIDVSEPDDPTSSYQYDYGLMHAQKVAVFCQGDYVYVSRDGHMDIFAAPDLSSLPNVPIHDYGSDLFVLGDYAYVVSLDVGPRRYLTIIDISNPFEPDIISDTMIGGSNCISVVDLAGFGQYAYIGTHSGLQIYNVSDPQDPSDPVEYNFPYSIPCIVTDDQYAYVQSSRCGIVVLDIAAPEDPYPVGYYNFSDANITDISVQGEYIYVILDDWSLHVLIYGEEANLPPDTPRQPSGPTEGDVGVECTFSTNTTDDGDQIYYNFSWGDDSYSGWIGPFESEVTAEASHTWTESGDYEIRAKAKDSHGLESDWSEPLNILITAPESELEIGEITGGIGITAEIKNVGDVDAIDVQWRISIDGGLIIFPREFLSDVFGGFAPGNTTIAKVWTLGIGLGIITDIPTITVTATASNADSAEKTVSAKILGPFVVLIQ